MNDLVLQIFAGLVGRGSYTSREIETPVGKADISVLGPTECNEIQSQRIGNGGIIWGAASVSRRESVGRKPCREH